MFMNDKDVNVPEEPTNTETPSGVSVTTFRVLKHDIITRAGSL